jgi:hypothetical protein
VVNLDVLDVVGQRLGVVLHRDAISLRWHVGRVPLAVLQSTGWEETDRGDYYRKVPVQKLPQLRTSLTNVPIDASTGRPGMSSEWGIGYQSLATADTTKLKNLLIKLDPVASNMALARTDLPMRVGSQAAFFIEFELMSRLHHCSIGVAQADAAQPLSFLSSDARMFGEGFWCVTRDDGNRSGFVPRFHPQKIRLMGGTLHEKPSEVLGLLLDCGNGSLTAYRGGQRLGLIAAPGEIVGDVFWTVVISDPGYIGNMVRIHNRRPPTGWRDAAQEEQ